MNVKKSLENRIRGWLPKEAKVPKAPAKMDFQIKPQSTVPSQMGNGTVRATKALGVYSVFFIILYLFFVRIFYVETVGLIAGLVSGLVFGLVHGTWVTQRIFNQLENHNRYSLGWKEYFLIVTPLLIFEFSVLLVSNAIVGFPSMQLLAAFSGSAFVMMPTWYLVRMVLFFSYEKTKKVFVMQNDWSKHEKLFFSSPCEHEYISCFARK